MAAAAPSIITWALPQGQAVDFPGEDGMILRSFRFVDLESPVEYFNTWLTPVPHFFVRNHMFEPTNSILTTGFSRSAEKSRNPLP